MLIKFDKLQYFDFVEGIHRDILHHGTKISVIISPAFWGKVQIFKIQCALDRGKCGSLNVPVNYYRLLDGTNLTTMDEHMWLIPFTEGESHWLKIDFVQPVDITGIRVWNYNKSPEDTYRGVS